MPGLTIDRDLEKNRKQIDLFLSGFFRGRAAGLAAVNAWGADFVGRMRPFVSGGKMIRGGLILAAHDRLGGKRRRDAVKAAAAMELFHSAFLIHDDIMDDDPLRRGRPSIHVQYRTKAEMKGLSDAPGFGRAAALCAGDVLIFMGLEILASLEAPPAVKSRVLALFGRELAHVGPAQVQDVFSGKTRRPVSRDDIFRLYTYKTARYTYALPLEAGALLAGAGPAALRDLEDIGRDLGLVFQIKDDELGQFGDAAATGKPVGSDVGEGKKTLYYFYLSRIRGPEAAGLYGKRRPTRGEISRLNTLLRTEKIPERIERDLRRIARRCENKIRASVLPAGMKAALADLLAS
ncbi:MAG: polyprenyl synthetase family protein, partial [Candidatus Aminicenantales bacterium]